MHILHPCKQNDKKTKCKKDKSKTRGNDSFSNFRILFAFFCIPANKMIKKHVKNVKKKPRKIAIFKFLDNFCIFLHPCKQKIKPCRELAYLETQIDLAHQLKAKEAELETTRNELISARRHSHSAQKESEASDPSVQEKRPRTEKEENLIRMRAQLKNMFSTSSVTKTGEENPSVRRPRPTDIGNTLNLGSSRGREEQERPQPPKRATFGLNSVPEKEKESSRDDVGSDVRRPMRESAIGLRLPQSSRARSTDRAPRGGGALGRGTGFINMPQDRNNRAASVDRPRPRTMTGEAPVPPNTDSCNTLIMFCYAVKKSGKSLVTWQKYFNNM